jgi:hypothetical protein
LHYDWAGLDSDPPINGSRVTGRTGMNHHDQLLPTEIGSLKSFCWGWYQTAFFLVSTSWLTRIIGMSHCPLSITASNKSLNLFINISSYDFLNINQ